MAAQVCPTTKPSTKASETRKAYGGGATRTAFAVLCAMMEAEHREESPARNRLTMEHVMPQKLTPEWRRALGDSAEEVHGTYRDRLANLTLSGDATNAGLGTKTFAQKAETYPAGLPTHVLAVVVRMALAAALREPGLGELDLDHHGGSAPSAPPSIQYNVLS